MKFATQFDLRIDKQSLAYHTGSHNTRAINYNIRSSSVTFMRIDGTMIFMCLK